MGVSIDAIDSLDEDDLKFIIEQFMSAERSIIAYIESTYEADDDAKAALMLGAMHVLCGCAMAAIKANAGRLYSFDHEESGKCLDLIGDRVYANIYDPSRPEEPDKEESDDGRWDCDPRDFEFSKVFRNRFKNFRDDNGHTKRDRRDPPRGPSS